jgi:transposase-like protein
VTQLTRFNYKPPYDGAKEYLVYSVNCAAPEKISGWMQGYFHCVICGAGNQYRFYDESPHHCKCPNCNATFQVEDDTDYDD